MRHLITPPPHYQEQEGVKKKKPRERNEWGGGGGGRGGGMEELGGEELGRGEKGEGEEEESYGRLTYVNVQTMGRPDTLKTEMLKSPFKIKVREVTTIQNIKLTLWIWWIQHYIGDLTFYFFCNSVWSGPTYLIVFVDKLCPTSKKIV